MRIWSLHPKYLDAKGLVAVWREALLAQHVLQEKTKGYRNHPQLTRFKQESNSIARINQYLAIVCKEAMERNYRFDKDKIDWNFKPAFMTVTTGQIQYEAKHLLQKLKIRDIEKHHKFKRLKKFEQHPMFKIIDGPIESWEIV